MQINNERIQLNAIYFTFMTQIHHPIHETQAERSAVRVQVVIHHAKSYYNNIYGNV